MGKKDIMNELRNDNNLYSIDEKDLDNLLYRVILKKSPPYQDTISKLQEGMVERKKRSNEDE